MKLKTAVISIVVVAALVAGGGYGAYYAIQGQKKPVEVVSVSNVNTGYWGDINSIYGTVTSQISQTVSLDEEYALDQVYVEAGDEVKEGTPLFSYDMTLQELELEMEELSLQTQELTLTKLEKDLEKLKNTPATASLEIEDNTLTASAEETGQDDGSGSGQAVGEDAGGSGQKDAGTDVSGQTGGESAGASGQTAGETGTSGQTDGETGAADQAGEETASGSDDSGVESSSASDTGDSSQIIDDSSSSGGDVSDGETVPDGLEVESVEEVTGLNSGEDQLSAAECANRYEKLVEAIRLLILTYGDELDAEDIGSAVEEAVAYYRKNLADEQVTQEAENDGSVKEVKSYVLKESVREALGEAETANLEAAAQTMDSCQVTYVELLIREAKALADSEDQTAFRERSYAAWEQYELLATALQEDVKNAADLESLPKPGSGTGETETDESETDSQSYTVTVTKAGSASESFSYQEGDTVTLTAEAVEGHVFQRWNVTPESVTLRYPEADNTTVEFTMPGENVTVEKIYQAVPDAVEGYINAFTALAEEALSDSAKTREDYAELLNNAFSYYQQWLAELPGEILEEGAEASMEQYALKASISAYLTEQGQTELAAQLDSYYKNLCLAYVRALYDKLNPEALVGDDLENALEAYELLGAGWQAELEQSWQEENVSQTGSAVSTIWDTLKAWEVLLMFQEYQALPAETSQEIRLATLQQIMAAYQGLTDSQKAIVAANQTFVDTMKQYGLWPTETEETEPSTDPGFPGGGGFDDFDDGMSYTAAELKEMIEELEREIKDCELEIRETELAVSQKQRIVDGKIVKSTLDGTVLSVGDEEGNSDTEYFIKVANDSGLYAKGAMNELALEQIKVGDRISGLMTSTGESFTAVIKEISEYPDPDGGNMYFGSDNSNASYYPFYALLDNPEDIEEGEAEIQLTENAVNSSDVIYLEKYFVRKENDGRSYVYKQGEDGLLTKQYIVTGKLLYSYAIEIVSGLDQTDKIAFPYGSDVKEGAETKEVDMLEM